MSSPSQSTVLNNGVEANNNNDNHNHEHNDDLTGDPLAQKSPMCRINEICRYNDIKHEYHLIEESGPPHSKTFTVVLKLGQSEEFRGSGPSIKKAQRSAAGLALDQTKLKQPPPRPSRHNKSVWPMTPTVELNVLAMKLGQTAVYHVYEPPRPAAPTFSLGPIGTIGPVGTATNAYDFRGMHYQRYHLPRGPYCATLTVGSRQFIGKGHTHQAARHAAAEEALKVLRPLAPASSPAVVEQSATASEANSSADDTTNENNASKSPISTVHEMALKRNLSVRFEVVDESGPSHMPRFVTQCTVGHIVCKGEGNSKKVSKKCAALEMVEQLKRLEPIADNNCDEQQLAAQRSGARMPKRKFIGKKKINNFKPIPVTKDKAVVNGQTAGEPSSPTDCEPLNAVNQCCATGLVSVPESSGISGLSGAGDACDVNSATIHPINRLIQLQQARKEKEPQFTLIGEQCVDKRRREFTIECTIHMSKCSQNGVVSSVGVGPNKKIAKKNAADSMLQLLGYSSRPAPQSILKQDSAEAVQASAQQKKIRQVKFVEDNSNTNTHLLNAVPKVGRQLVPGLILMPTNDMANNGLGLKANPNSDSNPIVSSGPVNNGESVSGKVHTIASIAKKFVESEVEFEPSFVVNGGKPEDSDRCRAVSRSGQLSRLAEAVGGHHLQVHFSDFPRKQANSQFIEYLSVVTITTVWSPRPLVSHGSGQTQDEARNQASYQALVQLAQLGGQEGHDCGQL